MPVKIESVEASIVVDAPVSEVYEHWTRVEEFPKFMKAVHEVRRMNPDRFYWRVERGGKEYDAVSQIMLRIPRRRIAWRTISGAESSGVVAFTAAPGDHTRISFKMKYASGAGWNSRAELLKRVTARLQDFKAFIEALPKAVEESAPKP